MPTGRRTPQRGAGRPRNSRPGRRSGAPRSRPAAEQAPAPTRFTGRMALLIVVAAVLVVSYASSMRAYLQQRSHIADLKAQIASSKSDIKQLKIQQKRWQDPAYVEEQARSRLGWVLPGETAYTVVGADGKPLAGDDQLADPASVGRQVPTAWWSKAYGTLQTADHPPKPKPAPAKRITADR